MTAALPRRDEEARARLRAVAEHARPVTLARERALPVAGALGELLPGAGLVRGTVVQVGRDARCGGHVSRLRSRRCGDDRPGSGWGRSTSRARLGAEAAAAAGVALERFPVVRLPGHSTDRWATVVAALLDGVGLVLTELPRHARSATPGGSRPGRVSGARCWSCCRARSARPRAGPATWGCNSSPREAPGRGSSRARVCSRRARCRCASRDAVRRGASDEVSSPGPVERAPDAHARAVVSGVGDHDRPADRCRAARRAGRGGGARRPRAAGAGGVGGGVRPRG